MKKGFLLISFLLFFASLEAQDDIKALLPKDKSVITGVLPNGIRYYIRKNSKPEKRAELRIAVNAGSTSEDDDQQGFAHLTEHMAFNGTEHFKKNELVDYLESVGTKFGAHLNAYTSFDETVYMIQLPTDSPAIVDKGLQILEDWAQALSFDSTEVEKERGVVIEEWRLGQGANERMRRKYWPLLFKDSRYAVRLPIGKKEIIEKSPRAALKRFYTDWYRPDLIAVIAVGDFDVSTMENKIKKEFSSIPARQNPRALVSYQVPDNKELVIATATDKEAKYADVEIIYKQPVEDEKTVGDYIRNVRQELFSSMLNARASELERLADPPFLNSSSGYGRFVRNEFAFTTGARCKEDGIERALVNLINENERVRRYGFTSTELERQKTEYLRAIETAFNEKDKTESRNLAREYVSNFLTGEPFPGIEYEYELVKKYINAITIEEVNAFASKWITDGYNCIVLITAPDKESTKMPSESKIRSLIASMKTLNLERYDDKTVNAPLLKQIPSGSKVTSEKKISELNITEWTLGNGVKVISKPTDFKNDEILFSSYSWGGWSRYSEIDFRAAASADEIIESSGLGDFDETALEKKLAGKIVSCSPYISELMEGFRGSCSPKDMETLMQLIYSYVVNPRKDSTAFSSWMEKQKGVLKNRNADPQSVFSDTIGYAMSGYDYHYRPLNLKMLNEIKLQRAYEIYKERIGDASGSVYFFVGNFNLDTLKKYSEIYLGALPTGNKSNEWRDIGASYPAGIFEKTVKMGQEPRSTVMLRYNMDFNYNRKSRNEVNALGKLMSIRLREVLREEKSGVYHVSFNSSPQHYPLPKLEETIYFSCDPINVSMLVNAANDVIKEIKEKGCDEKNLTKIKETAIRERETYLKENSFWLNSLSSNNQNGEDILDVLHYNDWVNSLKTSDFFTFSKKYIQQDNYAKFVLLPR